MNIIENNNITKNFDRLWTYSQESIGRMILYLQYFLDSFKPDLYNPDEKDKISFIKFAKSFSEEWANCWYKTLDKNIDYLVAILDKFENDYRNQCDKFYGELYKQEIEFKFIKIFEEIFHIYIDEVKVYSLIKQIRENSFNPEKRTFKREIYLDDVRFNIYDDIIFDIKIVDDLPKIKIISKLKLFDFQKLNSVTKEVDIREEIIQEIERLELKYA